MTLLEQIQEGILQLPPEKQSEVLDFVTFLQLRPRELPKALIDANQGGRIKKLLAQLAQMKTFADIADPVEWQRNIRKDRPLPGRAS